MSFQQPFLYEAEKSNEARFPTSTFDPKAVTRKSYAPKMPRPKQEGPLVSFNRHPDAHQVPSGRSKFKPMSRRTKEWIKVMRKVQLALRILELNGAIGLLVLMILITGTDPLIGWIMRITPGVVMLHCMYGIYHLSRAAGRRPPASSAAYHLFSGFSDLCVIPLYAFGALAVKNGGATWTTLLHSTEIMDVFVPAVYYLLISAGGVHLLSLAIALWLGVMFRRITLMPPDMNPLEDNLTSRVSSKHKRNKSSVAVSVDDSEKRLSLPLESRRRSGEPYENTSLSRPPRVPFMHTRASGSRDSSSHRDSRLDLPSRQYQITPGNSPRNSQVDFQRMSMPPTGGGGALSSSSRSTPRGSYIELPLYEPGHGKVGDRTSTPASDYVSGTGSRPGSGATSFHTSLGTATTAVGSSVAGTESPGPGKFTEAWYTSESLINRTQQRNSKAAQAKAQAQAQAQVNGGAQDRKRRTYEALNQRYDFSVDTDSDSEGRYDTDEEDSRVRRGNRNIRADHDAVSALSSDDEENRENKVQHDRRMAERSLAGADAAIAAPAGGLINSRTSTAYHPNPLRSNPPATVPVTTAMQGIKPPRPKTPYRVPSALSELSDVSLNERRVSSSGGGLEIADEKPAIRNYPALVPAATSSSSAGSSPARSATRSAKGMSWAAPAPKIRNSSIQPETGFTAFFSKPYGELKAATPPIMVGPATASTTRVTRSSKNSPANAAATTTIASSTGSPRVVSSGTDYYAEADAAAAAGGKAAGRTYGRRNVSGKAAEEGRAGSRSYSRYSTLNG